MSETSPVATPTSEGSSAAPASLDVALKEWALVCDLLTSGEQIVLVRKGGIHEPHRRFAIEHEAFLLYPNAEHQSPDLVRPDLRDRTAGAPPPAAETGYVTVPGYCRVSDVTVLPDLDAAARLEPWTCWTRPFYEMRFAYKPERPVYVALVRAFRFEQPATLPYHKVYAGCRSWVPLKDTLPDELVAAAVPALDDVDFVRRRDTLLTALARRS